MNIQALREHLELSIKANRLQANPPAEHLAAAEKIQKTVDRIDEVREEIAKRNVEIVRMDKDTIRFRRMSLFWWVFSCVPLLLLFCLHYSEMGNELLSDRLMMLEIYLPSAGILAAGLLVEYFIWTHAVLLVASVVLTSVYPIYIFGSSINWMWIYIALGTILTVCGRFTYYHRRIKKTDRWYKESKELQKTQHKLMDEIVPVYMNAGEKDREALARKFPGEKKLNECWISRTYTMKPAEKMKYVGPRNGFRRFDVLHPKYIEGGYTVSGREESYVSEITNQELGWFPLTGKKAKELIAKEKLSPLFGMGIPEFLDDLVYEAFHHKWTEFRTSVIKTTETTTHVIENENKRKRKYEIDSIEYDHLGMTADWLEVRPELSTSTRVALEDYQRRRKEILDEMPDNYLHTTTREKVENVKRVFYHDIYACLRITAPDGTLVGMYSSECGVEFALEKAAEHVNIAVSPLTIPASSAQRQYINQTCLEDKLSHV